MPTIYTGTAGIPYQAGFIKGSTAQKIYNDQVLRDEAKEAARLELEREKMETEKQANELARYDKLTQQVAEQRRWEKEQALKDAELELRKNQNSQELGLKREELDWKKSRYNEGDEEKNAETEDDSGGVVSSVVSAPASVGKAMGNFAVKNYGKTSYDSSKADGSESAMDSKNDTNNGKLINWTEKGLAFYKGVKDLPDFKKMTASQKRAYLKKAGATL